MPSQTKKGTKPNPTKKKGKLGDGKGRPAKGYDPSTKSWVREINKSWVKDKS